MGLIPSQPDLRPADVLTLATRTHGYMAMDVGICASHSSGAGENCVESMRAHKFVHYGDVLHELERESIEYLLATISCYGRRHLSVTQIFVKASQAAARRRGVASHSAIYRRWSRVIASGTWHRAARMIRACMPQEPADTELLMDGRL